MRSSETVPAYWPTSTNWGFRKVAGQFDRRMQGVYRIGGQREG